MNTHQGDEMRQLILASTSPWRRQILENCGINVHAIPSDVDESRCGERDPLVHAATLARWKAQAVARNVPDGVVLGADQVMWDGHEVFGKPKDAEAHFSMLWSMRGKDHWLYTAFCIIQGEIMEEGVSRTRLRVRQDLSEGELRAYVQTEEGRYCAGGYAIEKHGGWLFEETEGDWFNIIGLPLFDVLSCLRRMGWTYGG